MSTFGLVVATTLATLGFFIGCNCTDTSMPAQITPSQTKEKYPPDAEALTIYLNNPQPASDQEMRAVGIVEKAQVIVLDYWKATPSASPASEAEFTLSLKASHNTPLSLHKGGKTYSGISSTFSKFFGDARNLSSRQWLHEMRRPLQKDYRLTKVDVVLTPLRKVREESLARSQAAAKILDVKLAAIKTDFPQLSEYDTGTVLNLGGWKAGEWPIYPSLSYEHAIGPERKGVRKKYAEDWCDLSFFVSPITGDPQATSINTVTYPRQGMEVRYRIISANNDFSSRCIQMVKQSLRPLEDYERELTEDQEPKE